MRRGESEGMLRVSIAPTDDSGTADRIARPFVRPNTAAAAQIATAAADAYKRLLRPSIETEFAAQSKQQADEEAIRVFAQICNNCSSLRLSVRAESWASTLVSHRM